MTTNVRPRPPAAELWAVASVLLAACDLGSDPVGAGPPGGPASGSRSCDLETAFLVSAGVIDAIPSIDDPRLVSAAEEVPAYLDPDTRIVGLHVDGVAYAIPHNVLWFHEVVNLDVGGHALAVTYCPLTGSSLVLDRGSVGGVTLGISGLLYKNNLVLYDRRDPSSRWVQMVSEARCGPNRGRSLTQWPATEMEWQAWVELHPKTLVLAADQGYPITYEAVNYPYGIYEETPHYFLPDAMPALDERRFVKERVIGVRPAGSFDPNFPSPADPGVAFPFGALEALEGAFQAIPFVHESEPAVLLWSDRAAGGTPVRPRTLTGVSVTLVATDTGIRDEETGTTWGVDGRAVSGPLAGSHLVPIERSYVAFWGAWQAFHPQTRLWED